MRNEKLITLAIVIVLTFATLFVTVNAYNPNDHDAGQDGDAGDTVNYAFIIVPGSYSGNLTYPTPEDTVDFYNFTTFNGHQIYVNMTPPENCNYQLEVHSPTGSVYGSYNSGDEPETVDIFANMDGDWSIRVSRANGTGRYSFYLAPVNHAPQIPDAPSGPSTGFVYTSCSFSAVTTDSDNDQIKYEFDWNDSTTYTTGYHASGENATATHKFERPITYNITVRAEDEHNLLSGWSGIKTITLKQNDGGSGDDAGTTESGAVILNQTLYTNTTLYSNGTLYYSNPKDRDDYYIFTVNQNDWILATMTPPTNVNYNMILQEPDGTSHSNTTGPGQTESIQLQAEVGGNWSIHMLIDGESGFGQYNFTLRVSPIPYYTLTLKVSHSPDEGVSIWIDGDEHIAHTYAPVVVSLQQGSYELRAQSAFFIWYGDFGYGYTFLKWSDGVTSNPRTINLTQNLTLTAIYKRSKYPIY